MTGKPAKSLDKKHRPEYNASILLQELIMRDNVPSTLKLQAFQFHGTLTLTPELQSNRTVVLLLRGALEETDNDVISDLFKDLETYLSNYCA